MSSTATRPESQSRHAGSAVDGVLSRNPDGHGDAANEPCRRTSQTKRAPLVTGAAKGSCSTAAQTTVGSAPAGGACRWAAAMAASRERPPGGTVGPVVAQAQPETAGVGVAGGDATVVGLAGGDTTAHPTTLSRASRTTASLITLAGRSMRRTGSVASTVSSSRTSRRTLLSHSHRCRPSRHNPLTLASVRQCHSTEAALAERCLSGVIGRGEPGHCLRHIQISRGKWKPPNYVDEAAGDEDPPVGEQSRGLIRAGGEHRRGGAEGAGLRVIQLG
jgi:hypothetical protein